MSEEWDVKKVKCGDQLVVTDAAGEEHEAQALTGAWTSEYADFSQGRCRWIPGDVITVRFTTKDDKGVAWPIDYIKPLGQEFP